MTKESVIKLGRLLQLLCLYIKQTIVHFKTENNNLFIYLFMTCLFIYIFDFK